jgi:DNA-binding transcriptional LysR family regulator
LVNDWERVLKVTASADIGHALMSRAAKVFAAKFPDVSFELMLRERIWMAAWTWRSAGSAH